LIQLLKKLPLPFNLLQRNNFNTAND